MLEADENRRISSFEILNTPIIRRNVAEFSKELLSEQKQLLIENYLRRIGRDNQRELPANVVSFKKPEPMRSSSFINANGTDGSSNVPVKGCHSFIDIPHQMMNMHTHGQNEICLKQKPNLSKLEIHQEAQRFQSGTRGVQENNFQNSTVYRDKSADVIRSFRINEPQIFSKIQSAQFDSNIETGQKDQNNSPGLYQQNSQFSQFNSNGKQPQLNTINGSLTGSRGDSSIQSFVNNFSPFNNQNTSTFQTNNNGLSPSLGLTHHSLQPNMNTAYSLFNNHNPSVQLITDNFSSSYNYNDHSIQHNVNNFFPFTNQQSTPIQQISTYQPLLYNQQNQSPMSNQNIQHQQYNQSIKPPQINLNVHYPQFYSNTQQTQYNESPSNNFQIHNKFFNGNFEKLNFQTKKESFSKNDQTGNLVSTKTVYVDSKKSHEKHSAPRMNNINVQPEKQQIQFVTGCSYSVVNFGENEIHVKSHDDFPLFQERQIHQKTTEDNNSEPKDHQINTQFRENSSMIIQHTQLDFYKTKGNQQSVKEENNVREKEVEKTNILSTNSNANAFNSVFGLVKNHKKNTNFGGVEITGLIEKGSLQKFERVTINTEYQRSFENNTSERVNKTLDKNTGYRIVETINTKQKEALLEIKKTENINSDSSSNYSNQFNQKTDRNVIFRVVDQSHSIQEKEPAINFVKTGYVSSDIENTQGNYLSKSAEKRSARREENSITPIEKGSCQFINQPQNSFNPIDLSKNQNNNISKDASYNSAEFQNQNKNERNVRQNQLRENLETPTQKQIQPINTINSSLNIQKTWETESSKNGQICTQTQSQFFPSKITKYPSKVNQKSPDKNTTNKSEQKPFSENHYTFQNLTNQKEAQNLSKKNTTPPPKVVSTNHSIYNPSENANNNVISNIAKKEIKYCEINSKEKSARSNLPKSEFQNLPLKNEQSKYIERIPFKVTPQTHEKNGPRLSIVTQEKIERKSSLSAEPVRRTIYISSENKFAKSSITDSQSIADGNERRSMILDRHVASHSHIIKNVISVRPFSSQNIGYERLDENRNNQTEVLLNAQKDKNVIRHNLIINEHGKHEHYSVSKVGPKNEPPKVIKYSVQRIEPSSTGEGFNYETRNIGNKEEPKTSDNKQNSSQQSLKGNRQSQVKKREMEFLETEEKTVNPNLGSKTEKYQSQNRIEDKKVLIDKVEIVHKYQQSLNETSKHVDLKTSQYAQLNKDSKFQSAQSGNNQLQQITKKGNQKPVEIIQNERQLVTSRDKLITQNTQSPNNSQILINRDRQSSLIIQQTSIQEMKMTKTVDVFSSENDKKTQNCNPITNSEQPSCQNTYLVSHKSIRIAQPNSGTNNGNQRSPNHRQAQPDQINQNIPKNQLVSIRETQMTSNQQKKLVPVVLSQNNIPNSQTQVSQMNSFKNSQSFIIQLTQERVPPKLLEEKSKTVIEKKQNLATQIPKKSEPGKLVETKAKTPQILPKKIQFVETSKKQNEPIDAKKTFLRESQIKSTKIVNQITVFKRKESEKIESKSSQMTLTQDSQVLESNKKNSFEKPTKNLKTEEFLKNGQVIETKNNDSAKQEQKMNNSMLLKNTQNTESKKKELEQLEKIKFQLKPNKNQIEMKPVEATKTIAKDVTKSTKHFPPQALHDAPQKSKPTIPTFTNKIPSSIITTQSMQKPIEDVPKTPQNTRYKNQINTSEFNLNSMPIKNGNALLPKKMVSEMMITPNPKPLSLFFFKI